MIKLLLVDDEPIILEGLESMIPFDELGIVMTASCGNALEALDSMIDNMPDILITDVKMPGMDGLMLIERALHLSPSLQCVIISGYNEFEYARKALTMGVREYLLKPFGQESLLPILRRICNEIKQVRAEAMKNTDERRVAIQQASERLMELATEGSKINNDSVKNLLKEGYNEEILQSAYIYLISKKETYPESRLSSIQKVMEAGNKWPEMIAEGLSGHFFRNVGHYRDFVRKMCEYVNQNYGDEGLSLQFMANNVLHMSTNYIGHGFMQEVGKSFSAYLLEVRMEKAKKLILQCKEESRFYEIAELIGLGHNPQYFSQLFHRYTGMTPSKYSKENSGVQDDNE